MVARGSGGGRTKLRMIVLAFLFLSRDRSQEISKGSGPQTYKRKAINVIGTHEQLHIMSDEYKPLKISLYFSLIANIHSQMTSAGPVVHD